MAYKVIQVDHFLATLRRSKGNFTPGRQRMFGAVTDVGAFAKFLDRLVQEHSKLVGGSSLRDPKVKFDWKLVNVAKTRTKSGTPFLYFDAIDRGRKAIHSEGLLAFAVDSDARLFRNGVRASKPADITSQALGLINSRFPQQATELFKEFLNDTTFHLRTGKGRFAKNSKSTPLGNISGVGRVSRDITAPKSVVLPPGANRRQSIRNVTGEVKLVPDQVAPRILSADPETTTKLVKDARLYGHDVFRQFVQAAQREESTIAKVTERATREFDAAVRREIAKLRSQFKTSRQFAAGSGRALNNIFNSSRTANRVGAPQDKKSITQAAEQVKKILSKMSYTQLAALFKPLAEDQISAFEAATPSRSDNGRFKLAFIGKSGSRGKKKKNVSGEAAYVVEDPSTGGDLRASYVFMTDNQFTAFVNKLKK